jgi:hypothetical protein
VWLISNWRFVSISLDDFMRSAQQVILGGNLLVVQFLADVLDISIVNAILTPRYISTPFVFSVVVTDL